MKNRVIDVKLTKQSINNAIKELNNYKRWLQECTEKFLDALAKEGVQVASAKFQKAVYDGTNDVSVSVEKQGENEVAVVAIGGAVLFIEFGTGVKYPDDHPEMKFARGEYGHKLGRLKKGWRYEGDPGTNGTPDEDHPGYTHTYGNPANRCMYDTVRELEESFEEIARRCYT